MSGRMGNYSENCDYLREKFNLDNTASIYDLVNKATDFIRNAEEVKIITSSQEEKEQCPKQSETKKKSQSKLTKVKKVKKVVKK